MYLKEIQGFRFVAAILVCVYHIWFNQVSGSVDAFFVISGFLIFYQFSKKRSISFSDVVLYWQKTIARITPSASVVLICSILYFGYFGTSILEADRIKHAIASGLFIENWWLWRHNVDYLSIGEVSSPFQQFWALSVQVQIYILLPPLVYLCLKFRNRYDKNSILLFAYIVFTICAFFYAVIEVENDQSRAYFNTFARVWEFLSGGILALVFSKICLPPVYAKFTGYICLIVLSSFAAFIPVANHFPGYSALIPVVATIGILISSKSGGNNELLNNRVMQTLGNLSFTIYLWHWPLYIAHWDRSGSPDTSLLQGFLIILATIVLSAITYYFVELPFRRSRLHLRGIAVTIISSFSFMAPAGFATIIWGLSYIYDKGEAERQLEVYLETSQSDSIVPDLSIVKEDIPVSYTDECYQRKFESSEVILCEYGNTNGELVIALVGGSHSLQWLPALRKIAKEDFTIKIVTMLKSGCAFTLSLEDMTVDSDPTACLAWNQRVVEKLEELKPDIVFTTATRVSNQGEIIPTGYYRAWKAIPNLDILAMRDNPRSSFDIAACVDSRGPEDYSCYPEFSITNGALKSFEEIPFNVTLADTYDIFCNKTNCPAVKNNLILYRDSNHITATTARINSPYIRSLINYFVQD